MDHKEMDNEQALKDISAYLVRTGETLAVAESVTSGELQSQLSLAMDAMQFFQGGITVYNLTQKVRHLQIDPIHALSCNCVSDIVAGEMSKNVVNLFKTDWGIAITGYASPVPEKNVNELFAFASIYHEDHPVLSVTLHAEKQEPHKVRLFYVHEILTHFADVLRNSHRENKHG